MLHLHQSTTTHRDNRLERSSFGEPFNLKSIVQHADQPVPVVSEHRTDALTSIVCDSGAAVTTMPASPGLEKYEELLFAILSSRQPRRPAVTLLSLPEWNGNLLNIDGTQAWRSAPTLHPLQEWEGYVLEIVDKQFVARLVDLTAGSTHEEEEAVIPLAELSDEDAAKICRGSIFRWVIGYERSAMGTKKRVSQIVFRDLPAISKADLQAGEQWAHEAIRSLGL